MTHAVWKSITVSVSIRDARHEASREEWICPNAEKKNYFEKMTQISKTSLWKDTCSDVYRGRGRPQDVAGATSTSPGRVKVYAVLLPHVLVSNTQSPTVLRLYKKSFFFFFTGNMS